MYLMWLTTELLLHVNYLLKKYQYVTVMYKIVLKNGSKSIWDLTTKKRLVWDMPWLINVSVRKIFIYFNEKKLPEKPFLNVQNFMLLFLQR